ncbi:MAG: CHASE domain-containing protein [Polyangiaceae bacterium]
MATLLATFSLWAVSLEHSREELRTYFDFRVRDASARIVYRLRAYESVIRGARGLFDASQSVSRGEFRKYVTVLRLADTFPGIQCVGFVEAIPQDSLPAHEAAVRQEGFADYVVQPPGDRPVHTPIVFVEPFEGRNMRAFGYDMFSEPVRRAALEQARDRGSIAISGKVTLVQETGVDVQPGFLMFMPVYRTRGTPMSVEERRATIVGWTYAAFRMYDLMDGVLGEQAPDLTLELYDGETTDPAALLYDSQGPVGDVAEAPLHTVQRLELGGGVWQLAAGGLESIETHVGERHSAPIWIAGLTAGFVLTLLTRWLTQARAAADAHARELLELNAELESRVQKAVEEVRHRDRLLLVQSRQAAMGEMIGNIAHQWRQPLNALGLVLANLADAHELGELDEPTMKRLFADGHRLIQKMSSTIDDFRGFFRPDKEHRAFSAREQVTGAIGLVRPAFDARRVRCNLHDGDATLWGIPNELSQVLLNVLANAKDAIIASGATEGTIDIEIQEDGKQAMIRVRDTGGGIAQEALDHLFEPYFSTKPGGTGIGLYMSKAIIEKNMGGKIEAQNNGPGAEIKITLPLRRTS